MLFRFSRVVAAILLAAPAVAAPVTIAGPVLRVASPSSKTGAGYFTITNRGPADRLVAITTTAATRADLHGTVAVGGVMQMRAQAGGVPLSTGSTVRFAPGGLHVMFIGLKTPLAIGSGIQARLIFARAAPITVQFRVETAAGAR